MLDVLLDAVLDSLKTLPFLFGAFLLMEAAEKHYGKHMDTILKKSKWGGPLAGSILGCIPQCGFSVIASNLYAGGLITLGTLLSVYLSTSDEAIILLLADSSRGNDILKLMEIKMGRILKFNSDKSNEFIAQTLEQIAKINDKLEHIVDYTIDWFTMLKEKYGKAYPRHTVIRNFDTI